jgi:hypothetical protein
MEYPLSFLPNKEGFKFIGIAHDGTVHECIVSKFKEKHFVKKISTGERFFSYLRAWTKI